jgi:hypothetical protein
MFITDQKRLREIQVEFSRMYPYLKLEFYSKHHDEGKGSPKRALLASDKTIGEIRTVHNDGELQIVEDMTVAKLEQRFEEVFGLNAQVFRRSGNLWIQTTATDGWTLAEQNRKGGASEAYWKEKYEKDIENPVDVDL